MVGPLSITVGILAIFGAFSKSVKVLRSAYTTPQELARLETELDHLGDVFRDTDGMALDDGRTSNGLIEIINNARVKV